MTEPTAGQKLLPQIWERKIGRATMVKTTDTQRRQRSPKFFVRFIEQGLLKKLGQFCVNEMCGKMSIRKLKDGHRHGRSKKQLCSSLRLHPLSSRLL